MRTGWQLLDELELPADSVAEGVFRTWLTGTLARLDLESGVLNRILESAQEGVARLERTSASAKIERVRMALLVPQEDAARGQSWGFFRVEKSISRADSSFAAFRAIEFYLYRE